MEVDKIKEFKILKHFNNGLECWSKHENVIIRTVQYV